MLRGAAAAWIGLVALQAFTTDRGAGAVGGLLGAVDGLVKRALDPSVPAIPDRSHGGVPGTKDGDGNFHPTIPPYLGGGTVPGPGAGSSGQQQNPNFQLVDPPPPGQHNPAYDNPGNTPYGIPESYIPWPSVPRTSTA